MPGSKILLAIVAIIPTAVLLTAQVSLGETAKEECKPAPAAVTPRGSHWYYRINRAGQRCWYLGAAGAYLAHKGLASATPSPTPTSRESDSTDWKAAAAPSDALVASAIDQPAAAPSMASDASAADFTAARAPAMPAPAEQTTAFTARWVEGLPKAEDLTEQAPAPMKSSYAEDPDASDAPQQLLSKWPRAGADRATDVSTGDAVLRDFAMIGTLLTALLLAAGWAAKFLRSAPPEHWA